VLVPQVVLRLLVSLTAGQAATTHGLPCTPIPVGAYGVFVESLGEGCSAADFDELDGYVLVDHLASDNGSREVVVLVKPMGTKTYPLALGVVSRMQEGLVDGVRWHSIGPDSPKK
jgi:hypothetical protein